MVKDFNVRRLPASFRYATRGIWHALRTEQNLRIHFVAGGLTLLLAWLLNISALELAVLLLVIGFVLASEILNSVIEDFLDVVHPHHHQAVRRIKDVLAGSVLLTALIATLIGGLIFGPKLVAALTGGTL